MDKKEMAMHGYEFGIHTGMIAVQKVLQQVVANGEGLPSAIVALDELIEKSKTERVMKIFKDTGENPFEPTGE